MRPVSSSAPFITSRTLRTTVETMSDTFRDVTRELKAQKKEERWKRYEDWKKSCCCPECPSYNDCASRGRELLYCVLGMSNVCIREDRHCICPKCALYPELGLSGKDFCMKGSEAAVRYERSLE